MKNGNRASIDAHKDGSRSTTVEASVGNEAGTSGSPVATQLGISEGEFNYNEIITQACYMGVPWSRKVVANTEWLGDSTRSQANGSVEANINNLHRPFDMGTKVRVNFDAFRQFHHSSG